MSECEIIAVRRFADRGRKVLTDDGFRKPEEALAARRPAAYDRPVCGRFALVVEPEEVARVFSVEEPQHLEPRYNVAPTQDVAAVRLAGPAGHRELCHMRWGLIPSWADDPAIGTRTINARAETASLKPSFKESFRTRRCLIPASGFFEWKRIGSRKQPQFIHPAGGGLFAFGGLWDSWRDPEGREIDSCTILTTPPNSFIEPIHDRMPLILKPADFELWIDPDPANFSRAVEVCRPYPSQLMDSYPVSTLVNSPENDEPACLDRVSAARTSPDQLDLGL